MEDPPDISTWNNAQLKGACKQYGLPSTGLKKDLITRVTAHLEEEQRQKAEREKVSEPAKQTTKGPLGAAEKRAQRFAQRKRKPPPSFFEDPPLRLFAYAVEVNKIRRREQIDGDSSQPAGLPITFDDYEVHSDSGKGKEDETCDEPIEQQTASLSTVAEQIDKFTTTITTTDGPLTAIDEFGETSDEPQNEPVLDTVTDVGSEEPKDGGREEDLDTENANVDTQMQDLEESTYPNPQEQSYIENQDDHAQKEDDASAITQHLDTQMADDESDNIPLQNDRKVQSSQDTQKSQEMHTEEHVEKHVEPTAEKESSAVENLDTTMHDVSTINDEPQPFKTNWEVPGKNAVEDLVEDEESEQPRDPTPRTPMDDMENLDFIINSALNEDLAGVGIPDLMDMTHVSIDIQEHKQTYIAEEQRPSQPETQAQSDDDSLEIFGTSDAEQETQGNIERAEASEKEQVEQAPKVTEQKPVQFRIPGLFRNDDEKEAGEALLSLASEAPKPQTESQYTTSEFQAETTTPAIEETSTTTNEAEQTVPEKEVGIPEPVAASATKPADVTESTPMQIQVEKSAPVTKSIEDGRPRDPVSEEAVQTLIAKLQRGIQQKKGILENRSAAEKQPAAEQQPSVLSEPAKATEAVEANKSTVESESLKPSEPTVQPAPSAAPEKTHTEPEAPAVQQQGFTSQFNNGQAQGYSGQDAQAYIQPYMDYQAFFASQEWSHLPDPGSYSYEELETMQAYYMQFGMDYKAYCEAIRAQQQYQQEQLIYEEEQRKKEHLNRPVDYTDVPVPISQPPAQTYDYYTGNYYTSHNTGYVAPAQNMPIVETPAPVVAPEASESRKISVAEERRKRKRATSPPPPKMVELPKTPKRDTKKQKQDTPVTKEVRAAKQPQSPNTTSPLPFSEALNATLAKSKPAPPSKPVQTEELQPLATSTPKTDRRAALKETPSQSKRVKPNASTASFFSQSQSPESTRSARNRKQINYTDSAGPDDLLSPTSNRSNPTLHAPHGPKGSRVLTPPYHTPTTFVYIANLPYPLCEKSLRNYLATLAEPDDYNEFLMETPSDPINYMHVDMYKTHCYLSLKSQPQATRVRNGVHGSSWPPSIFSEEAAHIDTSNQAMRRKGWADYFNEPQYVEWVTKERTNKTQRWLVHYTQNESGIYQPELVPCKPRHHMRNPTLNEEELAEELANAPRRSDRRNLLRRAGQLNKPQIGGRGYAQEQAISANLVPIKQRRNLPAIAACEEAKQAEASGLLPPPNLIEKSYYGEDQSYQQDEQFEQSYQQEDQYQEESQHKDYQEESQHKDYQEESQHKDSQYQEDSYHKDSPYQEDSHQKDSQYQEEDSHQQEDSHRDKTHHKSTRHRDSHRHKSTHKPKSQPHPQTPNPDLYASLPTYPHLYPPLQTFGGPINSTQPTLSLEDLFCVTTHAPTKIYYLPVKQSIALERLRKIRAGDYEGAGVRFVKGAGKWGKKNQARARGARGARAAGKEE